jgi:signal recognition particle subunit SRP68
VLPFLVAYQRQHGLRHTDFQRYRRFCTRRIHRIRTALDFTHGKRNYKPAKVTLDGLTDERHLHILLFEIERVRSLRPACAAFPPDTTIS